MQTKKPFLGMIGASMLIACLSLLMACGCNKNAASPAPANEPSTPEAAMKTPAAREKKVYRSQLAGSWYPADAASLATEIDGYLATAESADLGPVAALLLPHAGYRYSGPVAAYGVKQLAGRHYQRVIVMGPSHRLPLSNKALVSDATHYATPLGETPLDLEFISTLKKSPLFQADGRADQGEHSVQIELPLLQKALGDFQLVPIVVGQIDAATARKMGRVLRDLIDTQTLVVVSSDFTHYGERFGYLPFHDEVPQNLERLDMGACRHLAAKDLDGFAAYLEETQATICGRGPIMVLLAMLGDGFTVHLLKYDTSGRITGDWGNSVSYVAAAVTGAWPPAGETATQSPDDPLSAGDKQQLLKLARGTMEFYLANNRIPSPAEVGVEITPPMETIMGAFVTLKKHGDLRGCIGEIIPFRPLWQAVQAQAVNAAVNDRRFPPVRPGECTELEVEISALTPSHPVSSPEEIVIGRHGVVLKKQGRQAVFLPQVAPEQGWDRETMLDYLSLKAGLPRNAWRRDAQFDVFEAIVFHEGE